MTNKFQSKLKIKKSAEFANIYSKNKYFYNSGLIMLTKNNNLENPRLGISIPKKNLKLSVQRNKIKRIIKESFRLNYKKIDKLDIVLIGGKNINKFNIKNTQKSLLELWKKIKI